MDSVIKWSLQIKSQSLFRRYFLINALVLAVVIASVVGASMLLSHNEHENRMREMPLFFAHIIEKQPGDPVQFLKDLNKSSPIGFFSPDIITKNGESLVKQKPVPAFNDDEFPQDYDTTEVVRRFPGPPLTLIRLRNKDGYYLLAGPNTDKSHQPPSPLEPILTLLGSIVIASAASMFLIFRSVRKRALQAETVINALQTGDLKARFPITRVDEATHLMIAFNKMAEEIERLVARLRDADTARITLLQELAHDIRTPLASLKSLNESLQSQSREIPIDERNHLLALCAQEIDYIGRLMNDLLFLGQVMEPRYKHNSSEVDIVDLIDIQTHLIGKQYPNIKIKLEFAEKSEISPQIIGEHQMLERLIRNALSNAFGFAKNEVRISIRTATPQVLAIVIEDDGAGLSDSQLEAFGKKRLTRTFEKKIGDRLSVGLGSVIMNAIAEAHGGQITIRNELNSANERRGAVLTILLPFLNDPELEPVKMMPR